MNLAQVNSSSIEPMDSNAKPTPASDHSRETCPICHTTLDGHADRAITRTICGHVFCETCLDNWTDADLSSSKDCPMCRTEIMPVRQVMILDHRGKGASLRIWVLFTDNNSKWMKRSEVEPSLVDHYNRSSFVGERTSKRLNIDYTIWAQLSLHVSTFNQVDDPLMN